MAASRHDAEDDAASNRGVKRLNPYPSAIAKFRGCDICQLRMVASKVDLPTR